MRRKAPDNPAALPPVRSGPAGESGADRRGKRRDAVSARQRVSAMEADPAPAVPGLGKHRSGAGLFRRLFLVAGTGREATRLVLPSMSSHSFLRSVTVSS